MIIGGAAFVYKDKLQELYKANMKGEMQVEDLEGESHENLAKEAAEQADANISLAKDEMQNIMKEIIGDIEFETYGECPESYTLSQDFSGDEIADTQCEGPTLDKVEDKRFSANQKFFNGALTEYFFYFVNREPLSLTFSKSGELTNMTLWIAGESAFIANFQQNVVAEFGAQEGAQSKLSKFLETKSGAYYKVRLKALRYGKELFEKILNKLCEQSNHNQTCQAHDELRNLIYPI
jgi:hypothetical protein